MPKLTFSTDMENATAPSPNGFVAKHPVQVARRNARERNRVRQVNMGFVILRDHIPHYGKNKKLSKVETLRAAANYIQHLQNLLTADDSHSYPDISGFVQQQSTVTHPFYHHHHQQQQQQQHQHQLPPPTGSESLAYSYGLACQPNFQANYDAPSEFSMPQNNYSLTLGTYEQQAYSTPVMKQQNVYAQGSDNGSDHVYDHLQAEMMQQSAPYGGAMPSF
ncbi:Achaete-scute -like protein 4 [Trichinella sp. T9]|nr:Achaete-scute -like protein 4 [Trichinella sp. T9]